MSKFLATVFFFFLFPIGLTLAAPPFVLLFGSNDCTECSAFKQRWIQEYENDDKAPVLVFLPVEDGDNFTFLKDLEAKLEIKEPATSFPILLTGHRFLKNPDDFFEREEARILEIPAIPQELLDCIFQSLSSGERIITFIAQEDDSNEMPANHEHLPPLLYFYSQGCQKCSRQMKELSNLRKLAPSLQIYCQNIATQNGQIILKRVTDHFGLEESGDNLAPMLVLPDSYITGRLATSEELAELLATSTSVTPLFWQGDITQTERNAWHSRVSKLTGAATIGLVALAGFFDGINPCAFATSIFLIGYLLYLKRKARDIIITGTAFCLGVFLTYLLFGFGLSFVIDFLNNFIWIKLCLYFGFAIAAMILAFWNLKDAFSYKKSGNLHDMDLGLSISTHQRIHEKIKWLTTTSSWLMTPAAVLLGILVSSMELACTGQIYLPTLAAINSEGLNLRAIVMLCFYNICFIIPLALITVLAAAGFGTKRIANWAKNNIFSTKLVLAVIFLAIAVLMSVFVFKDWKNSLGAEQLSSECFVESSNDI